LKFTFLQTINIPENPGCYKGYGDVDGDGSSNDDDGDEASSEHDDSSPKVDITG
jgi:hypothetical protein